MNTLFDSSDKWPLIKLQISHQGKAPKQYGQGVYRFDCPLTLSVLLPRRGWQFVKKSKYYVYLRAPEKYAPKEPFVISIKVPNKQQIMALARRNRSADVTGYFQQGEWPIAYGQAIVTSSGPYDLFGDEEDEAPDPTTSTSTHTFFTIGEFGVWYASVRWDNEDERYLEYNKNIIDSHGDASPTLTNGVLEELAGPVVEGEEYTFLQTLYERSSKARDQCIAFHGTTCMICGFDFERAYGEIGKCYIHVHHLTPLAAIGESYAVCPRTDLVPVCANCHAMLHRREPPYSPEDLKGMMVR